MSFPDPTPPPHQFTQPPFSGGDAAGYWPSFMMANEQQPQPDLTTQYDRRPPFKKPRTSENPTNFVPSPPMNSRPNPTNVPGSKGTSHIFYKTRLCAKFMEGTCRNGDNCTFAHGVEDLREPPPNWQDIIREKDRANGSNNSSWGDDQRMIHRMKICKKYYNGEDCPYGDKCNFLHQRPNYPNPPLKKFKVDTPGQRESSAISITGDAWRSSGDFDQTVFWKTKLCSKWEMGQCPFGERCHYAHGQSELRFSGSIDQGEQPMMSTGSIARNPTASVPAFSTAPANPTVVAPLLNGGDREQKNASKWKITKKVNRIYADWLDDLTPPHCSPGKEEI